MEPQGRLVTLTGERFERLDVYESYLSMDIPRELPRDLTIWIWGAYVDVDPGEGETRCYVRGYAPVVFRGMTGLTIRIGLYRPTGDFIRDEQGQIVHLERSWGKPDGFTVYDFQGVSVWPHGECDVTVHCSGEVTIDTSGVEVIPNAPLTQRTQPPDLPGRFTRSPRAAS